MTTVTAHPRPRLPSSDQPPFPTGALHGRNVSSSVPAAPRVTCSSSFWTALRHGGLHKWIADIFQSQETRAAKPAQARLAIDRVLKLNVRRPADWCEKFKEVISDAAWYKINFEKEIDFALWKMTYEELISIKNSCEYDSSLNWLKCKVSKELLFEKKTTEADNFIAKSEFLFFESAAVYSEGWLLGDRPQNQLWKKIDALFASMTRKDMIEKVALVISKASPWVLLPFAMNYSKGQAVNSRTLEVFRLQAWKELKGRKTVDFTGLTDKELKIFQRLVERGFELQHHAPACNLEIKRRAEFVEVSKSAVNLVNIDKKKAKLLGLGDLIKCLNAPEADLSADVNQILLMEAKRRIKIGIQSRYEILQKGLTSDSSDELVHSFWEFYKLACGAAELENAVGVKENMVLALQKFSDSLPVLSTEQFMRAKNLIPLLRSIDGKPDENLPGRLDASTVSSFALPSPAQLLTQAISVVPDQSGKALTERDSRLMSDAVMRYFPDAGITPQPRAVQQRVDKRLNKNIFDEIQSSLCLSGSIRKLRGADGKEIPVCETFAKDQARSVQEINGRPVFTSHIPENYDKGCEFVRQMTNLGKINERQIMMASRVATQDIALIIPSLARKNKMFSLTDVEAETLDVKGACTWLFPMGLRSKQNFKMKANGNLIANVRIFNDNTHWWSGQIRAVASNDPVLSTETLLVKTDPEKSYFSLDLTFEIDASGNIERCVVENLTSTREVVEIQGLL